MNPLQIFGKPAMKTMPASPLRNGQIIQGKVMKLFPNQRAEIQIGGQKVIAKLDASLTLHRSYHFQVQIKGGIIYLHVLAEQQKKTNDLLHLLHSLRLKSTKTNVAFMKLLLERLIPFDRGQLVQALSLLEGASGNEKAMEVLVYMIKNRLPMSEIVFQGLLAKTNYRQTELFQSFLTSVRSNSGDHPAVQRLADFVEPPLNGKAAVAKELFSVENTRLPFHLLQAAGKIPLSFNFGQWKESWQPFLSAMKNMTNSELNQFAKVNHLPFPIEMQEIEYIWKTVYKHQALLRKEAGEILEQWEGKINAAVLKGKGLDKNEFAAFVVRVRKLFNHFTGTQFVLANRPVDLKQVAEILHTLYDIPSGEKIEKFLTSIRERNLFLSDLPKEQLLHQIRQTISMITYEQQIAKGEADPAANMKAMLLQWLNESTGQTKEHLTRLLQFVHGVQLQSVREADSFIHVQLQIPAERMGLNKDVTLEMEGRKTKDGGLNPDYCRILFLLDLKFLHETAIDVMVQKRSVSMTVYNDTENIQTYAATLKPLLKTRLEELNYKLSQINFKPFAEREKPIKEEIDKAVHGVDYRI